MTHDVSMIGGCCGLSTRHVEALRAAVDAQTLARRRPGSTGAVVSPIDGHGTAP